VSLAAITFCVTSQQVFVVVLVYFAIDSVRKLLDTSSYSSVSIVRVVKCRRHVATMGKNCIRNFGG